MVVTDSRQREAGFESCAAVQNLGQGFFSTVYIACMNDYLAIDSGGYLYKQPSRINCSVAGCFPDKLICCLIEYVCQGNKV